MRIGCQCVFYQRAADTLVPMLGCHDQHGKVAIGQAVRDGAYKTDDLPSGNGDGSDLGGFDELSELLNVREPCVPPICCE